MIMPDLATLRALVVDVDGTLYAQRFVHRAMAMRIARAYAAVPLTGLRTVRALWAYRRAHEILRAAQPSPEDLAERQLRLASEMSGIPLVVMRAATARWMEREPLDTLASAIQPGAVECLSAAARRGIRIAAVSDYPARPKLEALGVAQLVDAVVCAQDAEVQRLKPDPRGLTIALERLGVAAADALYVGDRPDVDAAAAARAGMRCAIITPGPLTPQPWPTFSHYRELHHALAC